MIIRVPGDSPTIQAGINVASGGDTVLLAPGTYQGSGNVNLSFGGVDLVLRSELGSAATVIDCEEVTRGLSFTSGESSAAILEGVTITNGFDDARGAGVFCEGSSPILIGCCIQECVVGDDYAYRAEGGGVYCSGGSPTLIDCEITRCTASGMPWGTGRGGGLFIEECTMNLLRCRITRNWSSDFGGGLRASACGTLTLFTETLLSRLATRFGE